MGGSRIGRTAALRGRRRNGAAIFWYRRYAPMLEPCFTHAGLKPELRALTGVVRSLPVPPSAEYCAGFGPHNQAAPDGGIETSSRAVSLRRQRSGPGPTAPIVADGKRNFAFSEAMVSCQPLRSTFKAQPQYQLNRDVIWRAISNLRLGAPKDV